MDSGPQQKPLYGALTVYRERGAYLRRREQFDLASAAFDEAYLAAPEDVRTLLGRSLVGINAVKPQQAYADAQLAFNLDKSNITSRYVCAQALYAMSEFESSVVMHHRGKRVRCQPPYFKEGIDLGESAIRNCIGEYAGNVMHDFLPLIRKAIPVRDEHELEVKLHKSRIPNTEQKKKLTQMEAFQYTNMSRVLAMKYLGPMADDKFFLQKFLEDPRIKGANSKGSNEMKQIAQEALRSLSERQEMLRSQRPFYSIQLAEKSESKHETEFRKRVLESERRINAKTADRMIRQIEASVRALRVNEVVKKAERMQVFLDSTTPRTLADKEHYVDRLYRAIGDSYLSQHRMSRKSEKGARRRIAFLMGLPVGRPTSYDSVEGKFPYKFTNLKQLLQKLLKNLEMCENAYMKCWLMYEISYLLNKQKNYALAKFYAKRCQREAQEIGSVCWWLNGCFMLICGDMQQGNGNEVRLEVEEALAYCNKLQGFDYVTGFLKRCGEMVSEITSFDDGQAVVHREKQIMNVVDETLKDETRVLLKRISNMPIGRRFSVLPQKVHRDMTSVRRKRRQRGISIIPGQEKALPAPPQSRTLGFQAFEV